MNRFERQYILPGFGQASQQKLLDAKVLVVGAGGLGCPALLYLSAAGIGTIGIVDGDQISVSNLNRQVLFGHEDLGKNKASTAAKIISAKYPYLKINVISEFLRTDNILSILQEYDLIVDGSDNFPTRYLINDACVLLGKPLVFGAIYQNEGQVAIFNTKGKTSVNYRDIYPVAPAPEEVPNCNETGVLGVLPGTIGTMMASETIKLLTGYGKTLSDKMLFYNLLNHASYQVELSKNPDSEKHHPQSAEALLQMDYADFCGIDSQATWQEAATLLQTKERSILIDVRADGELPQMDSIEYIRIESDQIEVRKNELSSYQNVLLFCQTGIRSLKAAKILQSQFPDKNIQSIEGGILKYYEDLE